MFLSVFVFQYKRWSVISINDDVLYVAVGVAVRVELRPNVSVIREDVMVQQDGALSFTAACRPIILLKNHFTADDARLF